MSVARLLARGGLAPWLLALSAAASAQTAPHAVPPAVLSEPALQSPKALGAATLAVARAGHRLVAAGERGTVLLSDDGGAVWRQASVPVQATLTALRFVDERNGWAAGHLGVILHTSDGGQTWAGQLDGVRAGALLAAAAPGQHWVEDGPDKPFFDLDFIDAQRGFAVGAYNLALSTVDGGKTWQALSERLPNPKRLHLYAVRVSGGAVFVAGEQGLLMKSADGGASFTPLASPYKGSFFGLLAARSGSLIAYGLRGHAYRSADQGASWDKIDTGSAVSITAGIELEGSALVLLSQTGALLISHDDGRSFTKMPAAEPMPAAGLAAADNGQLVLASLRGMRRQPAP
ncbi:MAG: YCF48-related protein [Burkholderiales bacterium]